MKLSHAAAMAALIGATQAACSPDPQSYGSTPDSKEKPVAQYKRNADPKQAYLITMHIEGAPGPFASVKGAAQYDIVGEECLPVRDSFSGAQTTNSTAMIPVSFTKVSDTTYTATVYLDGMLDADYFGRGVCRWRFTRVQARLKATGTKEETEFLPSLWTDAVLAQEPRTTYFLKRFYPKDADIDNYPDYGQSDRSRLAPDVSDSELFTVTLSSRKVMP